MSEQRGYKYSTHAQYTVRTITTITSITVVLRTTTTVATSIALVVLVVSTVVLGSSILLSTLYCYLFVLVFFVFVVLLP